MKKCFSVATICAAVSVLLLATPRVEAVPYGFHAITANSVADVAIAESQLFMEVTDAGSDQVLFTFLNTAGGLPSSITDVYFDDGALLGIALIDNSDPGVLFSQNASPGNLPGGNTVVPPFIATDGFTADSDPPAQPNGVNPGESLGILFDLQVVQGTPLTFSDVLTDLGNGALRVGIHVQGFEDGGSESLIHVPAPSAALLGLMGVGLIGCVRKRSA